MMALEGGGKMCEMQALLEVDLRGHAWEGYSQSLGPVHFLASDLP